ncbi:hypothetical protein M404DRAFT_26928 [Pisolithus tinctorius Marx 270]|uniref:AMP-dependent synthetase/ligase domain-containing protein n=1 Tax=Pisolithus tinctorius Marx 270 TaxID=870435 RepID=A0A0C3NRX2_PISTI|nr:hypothetical protein M404DRAFT_26928 [Pisolithus tinctorius Marx 270]
MLRLDPGVSDVQDMQCMLDHLVLAFEQFLANPPLSGTLSVVEINSLAERENPARYSYVYDLLARRAFARPDSIAVECDGKVVYTYAGLDGASDQFAQYLKDALSVCPDDIVPLFLPQFPMAIVVLYAILKVGAVYLAVDIETPTISSP